MIAERLGCSAYKNVKRDKGDIQESAWSTLQFKRTEAQDVRRDKESSRGQFSKGLYSTIPTRNSMECLKCARD